MHEFDAWLIEYTLPHNPHNHNDTASKRMAAAVSPPFELAAELLGHEGAVRKEGRPCGAQCMVCVGDSPIVLHRSVEC